MSEVYKHICPTCSTPYEDNDPDIYFCPSCVESRKIVAKQVDMKLASRVSKRPEKSQLQIYDEIFKQKGFVYLNDLK